MSRMSRTDYILQTYNGPVELAGKWGRVRIIHFHEEPVRAWGYDIWVGLERIGPGCNTLTHARWVASNYAPEARPEPPCLPERFELGEN